ncbi:MAG TPA: glutamine synthetase, partial [Candidatus Limnocylindria bacterium]
MRGQPEPSAASLPASLTTAGRSPHPMPSKELSAALKLAEERNLRFVSLQFTDIVGQVKSVQVPMHQLEEAAEHGKWFDGSSIEG